MTASVHIFVNALCPTLFNKQYIWCQWDTSGSWVSEWVCHTLVLSKVCAETEEIFEHKQTVLCQLRVEVEETAYRAHNTRVSLCSQWCKRWSWRKCSSSVCYIISQLGGSVYVMATLHKKVWIYVDNQQLLLMGLNEFRLSFTVNG